MSSFAQDPSISRSQQRQYIYLCELLQRHRHNDDDDDDEEEEWDIYAYSPSHLGPRDDRHRIGQKQRRVWVCFPSLFALSLSLSLYICVCVWESEREVEAFTFLLLTPSSPLSRAFLQLDRSAINGCIQGETSVQIAMRSEGYEYCSSECTSSSTCASNRYPGSTAVPTCMAYSIVFRCTLECSGGKTCPSGADCVDVSMGGTTEYVSPISFQHNRCLTLLLYTDVQTS